MDACRNFSSSKTHLHSVFFAFDTSKVCKSFFPCTSLLYDDQNTFHAKYEGVLHLMLIKCNAFHLSADSNYLPCICTHNIDGLQY